MENQNVVFAILGGSVIIAAGLYFGLRDRGAAPATPAPPAVPTLAPAPAPAAPAPPPTTLGHVTPAQTDAVRKAVAAALETKRADLKKKCWDPLAAKDPKPEMARLSWNGTIGNAGKPTAWGLSENREAFREGLSQCVNKELGDLEVAPPASPTEVTVEFELP